MPARAVCPRRCAPRPWTCARPWSARDRGHGPISVHDKMASMGLKAPSPAWLARLFRREGVARAEPSKRPRAAWRRFDLPRPQRLLAARRHRVRPGRRAQGGDLPAPGRPLAPGGGLPGRPGRDQSGGHRRLRQGRGRPGSAPGARAADNGAAPGPSRRPVTGRPAGARALPGRRTPRRQTLQAHHPRATTSASTRPCSATRAGSPWPTPSPSPRETGRPLRPHPATPSAPTRACPGASPGSRPRTPPRSPRRPDRATTPAPSPRRARPPNPTPPTGPGCAGAGPSAPPAGAS